MLKAHLKMLQDALKTSPAFTADDDNSSYAITLYSHILNYIDMVYPDSYNAIVRCIPHAGDNPRAFMAFIGNIQNADVSDKTHKPTLKDVWPS